LRPTGARSGFHCSKPARVRENGPANFRFIHGGFARVLSVGFVFPIRTRHALMPEYCSARRRLAKPILPRWPNAERRHPEQPELSESPSAGEQGRSGASRRVHGCVGDGNADEMDHDWRQSDRERCKSDWGLAMVLIGVGSRRRSASQAIDLPGDGGRNLGRLFTAYVSNGVSLRNLSRTFAVMREILLS
jgi:hypothetical protein